MHMGWKNWLRFRLDNKKVKFIDLFRGAADRLVDGVKRVTDLGKKMTTGADGLIKSLGNGMANAAVKLMHFSL